MDDDTENQTDTEPPEGHEKPSKGRFNARELAAVAIAGGSTAAAAASAVGVNERTIRKWASTPAFAGRVEQLRKEAVASAVAKLSSAMTVAADELLKLAAHVEANIRLRASRAIIELAVRLKEHAELQQRVADLETRLTEGKGS
jgi:hypothetical protein